MPKRLSPDRLSDLLETFARAPTPEGAHALGASGSDEALPALVAASQDVMEGELALAIRTALRTLATPRRLARWLKDPDVTRRRAAAHALSARYEAHVPLLARALRHEDAQVRAVARRALTAWTRSEALHALMRELLAHDDARVRALAADALGALGDARDSARVARALEREPDEHARHALERALAKLEG